MDNKDRKNSQAHIDASARYNAKNYTQLQARLKNEDYDYIDKGYKEKYKTIGMSKAQFIYEACKYCIENNINFDDYMSQKLNK